MAESLALGILVASFVTVALVVALLVLSLRHDPSSVERALREELRASREEGGRAASLLREELARATGSVRDTVDQRLRELQAGNEARLEQMRRTVDEKLHETLEKRLGESFRIVSSQLEAVHKGLGEMQSLASGVGDLRRVLTNVKVRGTWGEVQLGAILEQMLIPEQYQRNVATRPGSREVVEFAVRLPGSGDAGVMYLPIDSKFPQEDYLRLVEAAEAADSEAVARASLDLARAVRKCAGDIRDKYLDPPHTTDFAILFLPTEGLFAEVLRQPGLHEDLQQNYRVIVTGPTTLAATLSSLRMGFRTLAIEKRASEVWQVLSAVKTEFTRFAGMLDKVKAQLASVSRTIDDTGVRTRAMQKKLKDVETLPELQAIELVSGPEVDPAADDEEV